jgi:linoleoyl-CoA desaturase
MNKKIYFKQLEEDHFYKELKKEVSDYFKQNNHSEKANAVMIIKSISFAFLVAGLYLIILFGNPDPAYQILCLILLGIAMVGAGFNIGHEALHNAYSSNKPTNKLLGYTMDLLGPSSYLWKINHSAHHAFTNIHEMDGDIKDSQIVRLCPHSPYHPMHRYQIITIFFIYISFYLLFIYLFNTINMLGINLGGGKKIRHPRKEILKFIFFKLLYIAIWIAIPMIVLDLKVSVFICGYLILSGVIGSVFTIIFALAHTVEQADFPVPESNEKYSWAEHQLRTTCNFRIRNKLLEHYVGGLNYQIEHHLFPNICSIHYPKISSIVKRVAEKHRIPYYSSAGFLESVRSHFKLIWRLSRPDR